MYRGDRGKAPPNSPWNDDDWLAANVQKMIDMENQPITGIASCWDYERGGWKKGKPQGFRDPMFIQGKYTVGDFSCISKEITKNNQRPHWLLPKRDEL